VNHVRKITNIHPTLFWVEGKVDTAILLQPSRENAVGCERSCSSGVSDYRAKAFGTKCEKKEKEKTVDKEMDCS
jgi:hypothetical protein